MAKRRVRNSDKKDFLLLYSQLDSTPFNWENINQNSRQSLMQMCIELKIPIGNGTITKRELIDTLIHSPRYAQVSGAMTFPACRKRLVDFAYPIQPSSMQSISNSLKIKKRTTTPKNNQIDNSKKQPRPEDVPKSSDMEEESDPSMEAYNIQPYTKPVNSLKQAKKRIAAFFKKKNKKEILTSIEIFVLWTLIVSLLIFVCYNLYVPR